MEQEAVLTPGPVEQNGAHNGRARRQIRSGGAESFPPNPWRPSPKNINAYILKNFSNFHSATKNSGMPPSFPFQKSTIVRLQPHQTTRSRIGYITVH